MSAPLTGWKALLMGLLLLAIVGAEIVAGLMFVAWLAGMWS